MIGNVIDKYEILQKVGEGGMASVYRGRHFTLGRDVAIKVLHPHLSSSMRNRQRFAREARAIEQLDHANILRIFDYSGVDSEDCYIVTEFIDGLTLQQFMQERSRLASEPAAIVGLLLTRALRYAHERGIIHRDLKPENVMLRRDGALKLMDFGIARFMEDSQVTMTGALVGSPAYMSPEQALEHVVDPRSDLFSLGTVLYYLVSGQLPFTGSNPSVILRNIIEGNRPEVLEVVPDLSPSLADIIERLLQTDPTHRFASAAELEDSLVAMLAESGVDPEEERWSLKRFLTDADGYREALEAHLRVHLLGLGRTRLAANEPLQALRFFNRLLALDPENPEVLELVQGLHAEPATPRARRVSFVSLALLLAGVGGVVLWLLGPEVLPRAHVEAPPSPPPATDPVVVADPEPPTDAEPPPPEPGLDAVEPPRVGSAQPLGVSRILGPHGSRAGQPTSEPGSASAPSPPTSSPAAGELAWIKVTLDTPTWAKVYIDGEEKGFAGRTPVAVSAGRHVLQLKNDFSVPWEEAFTVAPGETRVFQGIHLRPLPATVQVPTAIDGDCAVEVDGTNLGTVGSLQRSFNLPDPRSKHTITYACPGQGPLRYQKEKVQPGATILVPEPP